MSNSEESERSGDDEHAFVIPSVPRNNAEVRERTNESPISLRSAVDGDRRVEAVLALMTGDMTRAEAARHACIAEGTLTHDRAVFVQGGRDALNGRGRKPAASAAREVCNDRALHALGALALERYEATGLVAKREGS